MQLFYKVMLQMLTLNKRKIRNHSGLVEQEGGRSNCEKKPQVYESAL